MTTTAKVSSNPAEVADFSPLLEENRFTCLPGCGLCCSYRVVVTKTDRQRLQAAGMATALPEPWGTVTDGELALRRTSGFCLFLDSRQRCAIYDHRPEHCRAYPYLWTTYTRPELDVDFSCPGLGRGEVVPAKWRYPPAESPARQAQRQAAIREIEGLLRVQRRYAAPEVLTVLGERCLDELADAWVATRQRGSSTLHVGQRRPLFTNVEMAGEALPVLWESLSLAPRSVEELATDIAFLARHFACPRWNTRLSSAGEVSLYRFWVDGGTFYVEERGGPRGNTSLGDTGQLRLVWEPEALAVRRDYLERWLQRQLAVRLANNLALASLLPGGHVARCYLEFLVEVDWRLAVLAPALALVGGKETIDRGVALEAIRGSDGLLRAWCESARLGVSDRLEC